jgi:transcriptional regulator with XRE-family HTH domain
MRARLAQCRVAAGHSQESLAARLGVDRTTVGRWERGLTLPQPWVRSGLASALGVPSSELDELLKDSAEIAGLAVLPVVSTIGGEWHPVTDGGSDCGWLAGAVSELRRLLDVYDLPADGPTRPLEELKRAVAQLTWWRLNSEYVRIAECLPMLVPELTRGLFLHDGAVRSTLAGLLAQTYRAADAIADKFGFHDLSARIIQVVRWAAEESGDPLTVATASYVRAQTFFVTDQLDAGRRFLERAADQLTPGSSIEASAAYGALHMRAAVTAARAGMTDRAREHVTEAYSVARNVPDGVYTGTAFGPSSVRIHEVTLALDMDDVSTAMAAAAGWVPPHAVPAERRSHYYVDIARAQLLAGRPDSAMDALRTARLAAPQHIRVQPQVHVLSEKLSARDVR